MHSHESTPGMDDNSETERTSLHRTTLPIRRGKGRGSTAFETLAEIKETAERNREMLSAIEARVSKLQERVLNLEEELNSLQSTVTALTMTSDGYLKTRDSFFAAFVRDQLGCRCHPDIEAITTGYASAREGDPMADAELYQRGMRTDRDVFMMMYGITPCIVLKLQDDRDTIRILQSHATAMAQKPCLLGEYGLRLDEEDHDTPLACLHRQFLEFTHTLDDLGYLQNWSRDDQSPLQQLRSQFWALHAEFVTSLAASQS